MRTFVIIPEGLAIDEKGEYAVSDYYKAALDLVLEHCRGGDRIFLAPANKFGAHQPEDHFGLEYLTNHGCRVQVEIISDEIPRERYLDTLDNARYLKKHLLNTGRWPLEKIVLVCNRPHFIRGYLMFRMNGFRIMDYMLSRPREKSGRKMVKRLWFYDVPAVQYLYEGTATIYNTIKFILSKPL